MAKKLNLPNSLSLLRVILVPVFMASLFLMQGIPFWGRIVPALLFGLTAITDLFDGKIARKYCLVTNFGKFIDPLADKFMVFGALISILTVDSAIAPVFVWASAIIILRELAVTSLRLVIAGKDGTVLAASFFGKCKTVSQVVAILLILLDPLVGTVAPFLQNRVISYFAMAVMTLFTLFSGIDYLRAYLPLIDTNT